MEPGFGGVKRQHIGPHQVMETVERRGKPEVHIHTALTFVWGGDPLAILTEDRDQKEIEIGSQLAARMKHGKISKADVEQVFAELHHTVLQRLRETGALKGGQ